MSRGLPPLAFAAPLLIVVPVGLLLRQVWRAHGALVPRRRVDRDQPQPVHARRLRTRRLRTFFKSESGTATGNRPQTMSLGEGDPPADRDPVEVAQQFGSQRTVTPDLDPLLESAEVGEGRSSAAGLDIRTVPPQVLKRVPTAALPDGRSDGTSPLVRARREEAFRPAVLGEISSAARRPWLLPDEPGPPGIAADAAVIGDVAVRAASVVGPHHRCATPVAPRQDAYRLGRDKSGRYLIVAVSDGMSDSDRSDIGATVAASETVAQIRAALDRGIALDQLSGETMFTKTANVMASAARARGLSADSVRATLVAVVVPVQSGPDGSRDVWIASVADSSAWCRQDAGWSRLAGRQKSNRTDRNALDEYLPHTPQRATHAIIRLAHESVIAVVTDGISEAWERLPGVGEWFAARWRQPPPVASFILDASFEARGQQDDRTAVVVWCGHRFGRSLP